MGAAAMVEIVSATRGQRFIVGERYPGGAVAGANLSHARFPRSQSGRCGEEKSRQGGGAARRQTNPVQEPRAHSPTVRAERRRVRGARASGWRTAMKDPV
jgi:hypothetical protein